MTQKKLFRTVVFLLAVCMIFLITGCGGGSDGGGGNNPGSVPNSKQLTGFGFANPASTGVINETAKTVTVNVPFGTDVTSLVAVFSTSGVETTVNSVEQESGVTANDFTNPVVYTVTAADDSTVEYTVTVIVAPSSSKDITALTIPGQTHCDITGTAITVSMPEGTDTSTLTPVITHTGASITPSSGTAQDFTSPVVYTVTAADNSTQNYTVTVNVPLEASKVFDFMTDGDALVRSAESDWFFSGGYTGNYPNGYGYYMNQTTIAAPWFFTGDFTADFEFYLKLVNDDDIFRYRFSLVDRNWKSISTRKYFDFAAYYTDFPAHEDAYYQTGQGHGSFFSYDDENGNIPGVHSGVNTCRFVKSGSNLSVYMNGTFVKTMAITTDNLPSDGYSPSIHGHNSTDQADSNFYLRTVTIRYMDGDVDYLNWNE